MAEWSAGGVPMSLFSDDISISAREWAIMAFGWINLVGALGNAAATGAPNPSGSLHMALSLFMLMWPGLDRLKTWALAQSENRNYGAWLVILGSVSLLTPLMLMSATALALAR